MSGEIDLTQKELAEIAAYTIQKIRNYPKRLGRTVENYFDVMYPDEVKAYIMRREINNVCAVKT